VGGEDWFLPSAENCGAFFPRKDLFVCLIYEDGCNIKAKKRHTSAAQHLFSKREFDNRYFPYLPVLRYSGTIQSPALFWSAWTHSSRAGIKTDPG
jgi:hypothetical protein